MSGRTLGYWSATGLFAAVLSFSGLAHLTRMETMVEAIQGLGYPVYLLTILGTAKLMGVVALLAPGWPLLKEWAYAGFAFDLLGAAASHGFAGDPASEVAPPVVLLAVLAASYLLRPASRRLPTSPAVAEAAVPASGAA